MNRLSILLSLFPLFTIGQTKSTPILNSKSFAVGVVVDDCYIGQNVEGYCAKSGDKNLRKGTGVLIVGIQNCKPSYTSTTTQFYEILYNGKPYYIEKDKVVTDESYYSQIEKMSTSEANSFRNNAIQPSKLLYEQSRTKAFDFLNQCKTKGLTIIDWSFYDESEYTEGTSTKLEVYNPTSKTIKYLWFTFVAYNAVDDKIIDRKSGSSNVTAKAIGPIKPGESGSYEFSYVWFTDLVETAVISNIKVQYMDGTFKTITKPKEIILPKEYFDLIFEDK
jgi:hypothetical protein